ncbi:MAG: MotA/TolQ/ExbB proton channel family protein [Pseudomonadota bacterium]|nr:MotA/TolQ/ExbB proton channel family protein [Pseudomonadota bacterium]
MDLISSLISDIGGPVVAILVLFSLAATSLILLKIWQYWSLRPAANVRPDDLLRYFAEGENSQLRLLVKGQRNGRIQLIDQSRELMDQNELKGDELRTELFRRARLLIAPLENYLRPMEVIAMLAPLLGLFGTVLGMIEAFKAMEAAGSQVDPAVLSGGIWQALLTTAVGLAVAIPVTMIHSALERKAETEAAAMQNDLEYMLGQHARRQRRMQQPQGIRRA